MGDPGPAVLPVVFVDGDRTVDLGTVAVSPSPGAVRRLQAAVADRVGVAPHQISPSLARPRRGARRAVPLEEGADLAAAVAREGAGCYVLAGLRRSRRERRGGRSRRDKKNAHAANAAGPAPPEKTILKRLPPTDLASLADAGAAPPHAVFGHWDYEAQLLELQRQREWYLMRTAAADPYFALAPPQPEPDHQDPAPPQLRTPLRAPSPSSPLCPECEAAAAAARAPAFHWCVRDAVTVGFRSPVGPIERPAARKPTSPPPAFLGMPVY